MAVSSEFRALVEEMMDAAIGPITIKRMFSGLGLFRDGVMFALVIDDTLYLKTGLGNADRFAAAGLEPFAYDSKVRRVVTSYARAPEDALEDADILRDWARDAIQAAFAAAQSKPPKRPRG